MPIKAPIAAPESARRVAAAVQAAGGRAWLVGGTVRDAFLGRPANDVDLEVHGLDPERLERVLKGLGTARRVGRSFGVFKVRIGRSTVDVSLPRPDSAASASRGDVEGDPHLSLAEAARRRDLSINALAWDPLTGEVEDPCGGLPDLHARVLRAAWLPRFGDDPLRALRVVRFAGVLGFSVDPALAEVCRSLDPGAEAPERQRMELEKLWLRAARPGEALALSVELGVHARVLPELAPARHAARGAALDRAAPLRDALERRERKLSLMWATLVHLDPPGAAEALFDRLRVHSQDGYAVRAVALGAATSWRRLVGPVTDAELRALAESTEVSLTAQVAHAATGADLPLAHARRAGLLGVATQPLPALLSGRDLRRLGVPAGPQMGALLQSVRAAQLAGDVTGATDAIAWVERLWSSQPDGPPHARSPAPDDSSEPT